MSARVPPIAPGTRPELAEQEAAIIAERGRVSPLYQVLLNSPPIAHGWEQLLTAVRNRSSLPADLREMVILRIAVLNRAPYEFEAHVPHALKAGMTDTQIAALRLDNPGPALDARALAVLALADTMTRHIEVPDAIYKAAREHFSEQQMVDLLVTVSAYNMVSRFLTAAGVGH